MSKVALRLGIGLESEGADDVVEDLRGDDTVEGEMLEVQEAAADVQLDEEAVEELEEAAEGLEAIALSLESEMANGGLDPQAAQFAAHAIDAHTKRLGVTSSIVPSMESFGGASGKLQGTQVSLEGLKDILAKIWAKIKSMLQSVKRKLKEYWLKMFDAAPKLVKRAEAIQKKAQGTTGTAKEKTVKGPLKALHIGGKAPNLVKALGDVQGELVQDGKEASKAAIKASDMMASIMEGVASKPEEIDGADAKLNGLGIAKGGSALKRFGEGMEGELGQELPGGKAFYTVHASDDSAVRRMATLRAGIADHAEKAKDVESTGDFSVLSLNDIDKVCDIVIKLGNNIVDYKRDWEAREKALAKLEKAGDKLAKSGKGDDLSSEQQGKVKKLMAAASNMGKSGFTGAEAAQGYVMNTARAALSVCEKSLSQYKD